MQFDSLIDWIKLPFISSHARSKHFSAVSVFCSFCLACFLLLLLVLRRVDGIQRQHWFPKAVEVNVPGREYQSEDAQCGEGKGGQWQGGCFLKAVWADLMIKEVRDKHSANWHRKGCVFLNCLAEHHVLLQVTPENKTCRVPEKPSPLASHEAEWSHRECFPWFLRALERSEMSMCTISCCETRLQKIRELCHWWLHHPDPASFLRKVATRRCQKSAPLTPPPSCSFTSKNMNQALKRAVSEGWFSCDYCLGEGLCLGFLQTALFAEQNTLGSCPIDTFLFKEQIQLQSEMQI